MWAVLNHLTGASVLPLGARGVHALDIGTGPAPALYAIDDYYSALADFARESQVEQLRLSPPELGSIENSPAMAYFMHRFSEHCQRRGPFGPTVTDFSGLDFRAEREFHFRNYQYETYWEPRTGTYEEWYDPQRAAEETSCMFRYRLVVFSNFLTLGETVQRFQNELTALFNDLRAGCVVVVLGGTDDKYRSIYAELAELATAANLTLDRWDTDELGRLPDARFAKRIKACQFTVYQHLAALANGLPQAADWPDYWRPEPSDKARSKFALRVFRCGRWPAGKALRGPGRSPKPKC